VGEIGDRIERLRTVDLLSALDRDTLALVASHTVEVTVPAGSTLTHPRHPGAGMFLLEEGRAKVELRGGEEREIGPGSCFGELALLTDDGERTARVRAETDLRCFALSRKDFEELLEQEPQLARALLRVLASRLARA
jgi:CRP-like cAMP-binding protein